MALSDLPPYSRKRPLRRGDIIVSPEGKRRKVLRITKQPCTHCGGTGVSDWIVKCPGPYKTKVNHKYSEIVTAKHQKEERA